MSTNYLDCIRRIRASQPRVHCLTDALGAMLDLGQGSGPMNHAFAIANEFTKSS